METKFHQWAQNNNAQPTGLSRLYFLSIISSPKLDCSEPKQGDFLMAKHEGINFATNPLQQSVYIALDPDGKYPRTQTMVSSLLHISKSTVADSVKKLCNLGFIRPFRGMKRDILYHKGKNHSIIEEYINVRKRFEITNVVENDQGIYCLKPSRDDHVPTIRAHLNGGWLVFVVEQEGKLKDIVDPNINNYKWSLFGDKEPSQTNGAVNYYGKFSPNEEPMVSIRYQRTDKGNKLFYLAPNEVIIVESQMPKEKNDFSLFKRQYVTILSWLEKYGGWKFLKNECGEYVISNNNSKLKRGLQIEYAFDGTVTNVLEGILGRFIGTPGISSLWEDSSPGSQSNGREMETANPEVVHAVCEAIKNPSLLSNLMKEVEQLNKEMRIIKEKIE